MNCPGSVQFTEKLPKQPSSIHAEEGTRAHAVAELCLRQGRSAGEYFGQHIEGGVVTQEMCDAVQVYLDHVRSLITARTRSRIEHRFDLAILAPPVPMFGTADFVTYDPATKTLHVVDLKYGQGVVVEPLNNPQLAYYALGALYSPDFINQSVRRVHMTIVQPRAGHPDGPVRTWEADVMDIAGTFKKALREAAERTQDPNAPLIAGSHCRWCPAAGICPAQREHALQIAQSEFSVVDPQPFTPPPPETIGDAEFAAMLGQLHVLEDWASAMRAHAEAKLRRGEEVPGFKLVERRAVRKWKDPSQAARTLRQLLWHDEEIFTEPQLKSPAQIEKMLGKKDFAASAVSQYVVKESSGYRVATDSDPSPAVSLSGGSEFALLPAPLESPEED